MMTSDFYIDILPEPQKRLWSMLWETPSNFVLYGGTALALRLGHRESVDFDFFSRQSFDPWSLHRNISYLKGSAINQNRNNTLTCTLDLGGNVMVSYFGDLDLRSIQEPDEAQGAGIQIASLLDIAATKAAVVQTRSSAKDYIDLDALLHSGLSLESVLGAAKAVFGSRFNPVLTLKALSYYDGGDLDQVPRSVRNSLLEAVVEIDLHGIPEFESRTYLCRNESEGDFSHEF